MRVGIILGLKAYLPSHKWTDNFVKYVLWIWHVGMLVIEILLINPEKVFKHNRKGYLINTEKS